MCDTDGVWLDNEMVDIGARCSVSHLIQLETVGMTVGASVKIEQVTHRSEVVS